MTTHERTFLNKINLLPPRYYFVLCMTLYLCPYIPCTRRADLEREDIFMTFKRRGQFVEFFAELLMRVSEEDC